MKKLTMASNLMTVAEVASVHRVTPRAVRGWIASGQLKVIRAGRRVLVSPTALTEFLSRSHGRSPLPATPSGQDLVGLLARKLRAMECFQDRIAVVLELMEMSCTDQTEDEVQQSLCDIALILELAAGRAEAAGSAWVHYTLHRQGTAGEHPPEEE